MGDIADMMLDGTLDEETGEYIGDHNLAKYGTESPGFPISLEREARENIPKKYTPKCLKKVKCKHCGKHVKETGLNMHIQDMHGDK